MTGLYVPLQNEVVQNVGSHLRLNYYLLSLQFSWSCCHLEYIEGGRSPEGGYIVMKF